MVLSSEEGEPEESAMVWSSKEERKLWAVLDELDKVEHKAEKIKLKKEKAKVARARAKMKVGRGQPSILELLSSKSVKTGPTKMGGGSVNTHTGSVEVAAPQTLAKKTAWWTQPAW